MLEGKLEKITELNDSAVQMLEGKLDQLITELNDFAVQMLEGKFNRTAKRRSEEY